MKKDLVDRKRVNRIILEVTREMPLKMRHYLLMKVHNKIIKIWM